MEDDARDILRPTLSTEPESGASLHEAIARIAAERRAHGRPAGLPFDTRIAGIVRSRAARQAARNLGGFDDRGIEVADPLAGMIRLPLAATRKSGQPA